MKASKNCIELIKKFEGCKLKAYKDAAGVLTIGYGHTKNVKATDVITQSEADAFLVSDLERFEANVNSYKMYSFNQNEFDALVSFAFNMGSIRGLTNNGKRTKYQIAQKIQAYVNAGGKKLNGLVKRRKAEYDLFVTPLVNIVSSYEIGKTYKVQVSGLRVRAESTTLSKAIKTIRKNSSIKCLDVRLDTSGNTWIKISDGYIAAIYEGKEYVK